MNLSFTFNSLFEIPFLSTSNVSILLSLSILFLRFRSRQAQDTAWGSQSFFQFSFWDSERFGLRRSLLTQRTFNSLFEIPNIICRTSSIFWLGTFNSLFEILTRATQEYVYTTGTATTFNSLFEIQRVTLKYECYTCNSSPFNSLFEIRGSRLQTSSEYST